MKKLKVNKKNFNHVESFRANCTCVCKCVPSAGNPKHYVDMSTHADVHSKFYERGAGVY